jgi:hypothetical protein
LGAGASIEEASSYQLEVQKCGYGRLSWRDGSTFEGFWHNNQPISIGVFKTNETPSDPDESTERFEGKWDFDEATRLCVFRQNEASMSEPNKGIEVWSDGSYYCGAFSNGLKQGDGVYYWADGSRY